jgi:hypothetical protein
MNSGVLFILIALYSIICGVFCMTLAENKGYGVGVWFLSGFFFGILALIAAAGLPLKRDAAPPFVPKEPDLL